MPDQLSAAEWKSQLAKRFRGRTEVLAELEDHLDQQIEQLTRSGHPAEEAVHIAIARLGPVEEIGKEFAKVPAARWLPANIVWLLAGLLCIGTLWPMFPKLSAGGTMGLMATHMASVMLGYTASLLAGILAGCFLIGRLFRELPSGQHRILQRATRIFVTLALLLTGFGMTLSYWCPQEKTGPVFGWEIHEVTGIIVLMWNSILVIRCWSASFQPQKLMPQMLTGSLLVTFGWFATSFSGNHGSIMGDAWVFGLVAVLQIAIGLSAYMPAGCLRPHNAS